MYGACAQLHHNAYYESPYLSMLLMLFLVLLTHWHCLTSIFHMLVWLLDNILPNKSTLYCDNNLVARSVFSMVFIGIKSPVTMKYPYSIELTASVLRIFRMQKSITERRIDIIVFNIIVSSFDKTGIGVE